MFIPEIISTYAADYLREVQSERLRLAVLAAGRPHTRPRRYRWDAIINSLRGTPRLQMRFRSALDPVVPGDAAAPVYLTVDVDRGSL